MRYFVCVYQEFRMAVKFMRTIIETLGMVDDIVVLF